MAKSLSRYALVSLVVLVLVALMTACGRQEQTANAGATGMHDAEAASGQTSITLAEYLNTTDEQWFLTGKKKYSIQAMMVSKETSFHNDLEVVDYTVTDDGNTVILKGTAGEMWATGLSKVIATYTKPDGSPLTKDDFAQKDTYIDIVSIPSPDSNYAMFVPRTITVTLETAWGDVLHTNCVDAPHGDGDYLVCRVDDDLEPDLSDVWIVNGAIFPNTYDTSHLEQWAEAA